MSLVLYYLFRGGSWRLEPPFARASLRYRPAPVNRYEYIGFRCARKVL